MKPETRPVGRRSRNAADKPLRRLIKAPENAFEIFEFAESLYLRDESAERMTLADIEQIYKYLKETERDLQLIKKQFQDLAELDDVFYAENIPVGF